MHVREPDLRVFLALLITGTGLIVLGRCVVLMGAPYWGWSIAGPGAVLILVTLWCLVYAAAPRFARVATALAVCAAMFASVFSCWVLQAREQARQQKCVDNLRQMGVALHERSGYAPRQDFGLGQDGRLPPLDPEFTAGRTIPPGFFSP